MNPKRAARGKRKLAEVKTTPIKIHFADYDTGVEQSQTIRGWTSIAGPQRSFRPMNPLKCVAEWSPFDRTVIHLQVNNGKGRGTSIYLSAMGNRNRPEEKHRNPRFGYQFPEKRFCRFAERRKWKIRCRWPCSELLRATLASGPLRKFTPICMGQRGVSANLLFTLYFMQIPAGWIFDRDSMIMICWFREMGEGYWLWDPGITDGSFTFCLFWNVC